MVLEKHKPYMKLFFSHIIFLKLKIVEAIKGGHQLKWRILSKWFRIFLQRLKLKVYDHKDGF